MSDDSGREIQHGLIFLKCHGCKAPTLFRLTIRHEADSTEFFASTHCASCEEENPLRGLRVRRLEYKLVENQRVDAGCFEANRGENRGA